MMQEINENCIIINDDCYKVLDDTIKSDNDSIIIKERHHLIDLILIDPPYDIPSLHKNKTYKNEFSFKKNRMVDEIKSFSKGFDFKIFDYFKKLQTVTNIIIFCNKTLLIDLIRYFKDEKYIYEILIWHKTNPTPMINNTFLPDIEYILYVRDKKVKLYGGYNERKKVFSLPANIDDKKLYKHPTIKPIEILNNLIKFSTKENDVVLDCFMGSGSTGVACRRNKRKFIGIEKDPKWYDIAKKRLTNEFKQQSIFDYAEQM